MKTQHPIPDQLREENFDHVKHASQVLAVKFEASWCGACKMLEPIFGELAKDFAGKATLARVDVENNPALVSQYRITSLPTLLLFNNGVLVKRHIGVVSKKVLAEDINQLLGRESFSPAI